MKKVNWGILGCAKIAVNQLIPAIQKSANARVHAIASRDENKARKTATKLNIPIAYGHYEQLLEDPQIDAVYIPLPNHLHYEWTIKAAKAGKHVLCEKPLALNAKQAQEMIAVCEQEGVYLAEAFMYRFHPRYDRIKQILASGEIGDIRGLYGAFTFDKHEDYDNVRNRQNTGGGSLYDVGCYPIHATRHLLSTEPEAVTMHSFFSSDHDGVDMMSQGLLEFDEGVALSFSCGMWSAFQNVLYITGSKGKIEMPSAYVQADDLNFSVHVDGEQRIEEVSADNHYVLQVESFSESMLQQKELRFPIADSLHNMRVIDACYQSARGRVRVFVESS